MLPKDIENTGEKFKARDVQILNITGQRPATPVDQQASGDFSDLLTLERLYETAGAFKMRFWRTQAWKQAKENHGAAIFSALPL